MKLSITMTALAATAFTLGACSNSEEAAVPEPTEEVAEAEATPTAVDGGPIAGDYVITAPDGETQKVTLTEDGTATYTAEDGTTRTGTYTGGTGDEPYCVTGEDGGEPYCSNQSMEDGVWTARSVDDPESSVTVTRVMAE